MPFFLDFVMQTCFNATMKEKIMTPDEIIAAFKEFFKKENGFDVSIIPLTDGWYSHEYVQPKTGKKWKQKVRLSYFKSVLEASAA